MADNKVVLEFELQGNATEKTQSLRAQMRQLREELARLPEGTAEYNKIQRELGALTDKVQDLGRSVNTLAGDPLERLNNSFSMVGSSLMSLDFGGAITGLNGVTGAVKEIKFGDVAEGVKNVGNSFANLGKALLTNPFFLIAGTIALIAMNFDKLLKMFPGIEAGLTGINEQERELAESAEARAKASQDAFENIDKQSNILKLQGKTEKEIAELKLSALKTAIAEAETRLGISKEQAKSQIEASERNRKILDGVIQWITSPLQILLGTIDAVGNALGQNFNLRAGLNDMIGDLIMDPEEISKDLNDGIKQQEEALLAMKNNYAGIQLQIRAIDQKTADDKVKVNEDANKKIEDDTKKQAENELEIAKKTNDLLKQIKNERIADEETLAQEIQNIRQGAEATELQNLRDSYFEKIELAKKYGLDATVLEEDLKKKEQEIRDKYKTKEVEQEKLTGQQKIDIAFAVAGNLMSIMDSLGKQDKASAKRRFNINKALGVAQAGINTYMAVNAALTAGGNPIKLATGAQFVEAGVALTMGLANVAKIAATKFNDGGGSTAPSGGSGGMGAMGGGGGGSTSAPALDLSFLNNGQTKAQPLQTYVLATNVTSAQDAQQKILDQSKLIK
jgi:hypothetical protein